MKRLKNGIRSNYGAKKIIKIQNYLALKKKKKQMKKLLKKLQMNGLSVFIKTKLKRGLLMIGKINLIKS